MPQSLADEIQRDLVAAMKSHDEAKLSALRMLKSAIQTASAEKGRSGELTDEDIQALIRRSIKQREEAAEQYKAAGADDRAANELAEAEILKAYMPAQLSDDEIVSLVRSVIEELGASTKKDIGKVMGAATKRAAGRADGRKIKAAADEILQ